MNRVDPLGLNDYAFYAWGDITGHKGDPETFQQRALQLVGKKNSFRFNTGETLITRIWKLKDVRRLYILSHGFVRGIMGKSESGIYRPEYGGSHPLPWRTITTDSRGHEIKITYNPVRTKEARDISDLAKEIIAHQDHFRNGSTIYLMACNTYLVSKDLPKDLGSLGRGDIIVYGTDSSCYESEGLARVDSKMDDDRHYLKDKNNHYIKGRFYGYRNGETVGTTFTIKY